MSEANINPMRKAPRRISQTVLNSLKGGVVPRIGLPYITVGRKSEIEALLHDVELISEGGASFRFIVGRYGSGKSFLLQTIRNYVMERGFIVADADLSPERRLQGTRGQGLATYRELIGNLSTKTKPEGGALSLILDRWIGSVQTEVLQESGLLPDDHGLSQAVDRRIYEVSASVSELVHGFEFARLLSVYYHAYLEGDDPKKACVLRWFRGEYTQKREAKEELGVNIIITDDDWYDYLKVFAVFFRLVKRRRGIEIYLELFHAVVKRKIQHVFSGNTAADHDFARVTAFFIGIGPENADVLICAPDLFQQRESAAARERHMRHIAERVVCDRYPYDGRIGFEPETSARGI